MKIKTILQPTEKLSTAIKEEMRLLYQQFYTLTSTDFNQIIATYNYFSFFTENGRMVGFVGIEIHRPILKKQTYLLCRFGQAVILTPYQGKGLLQKTVLKFVYLFWRDVLAGRLFCWGNASTYKSYLVFAKTAENFYPNYQQATPYELQDLIDFIGTNYFATTYEATLGIVKQPANSLRDNSNLICHKYKAEPNIRFFLEINPHYKAGHGVITIAPMNWTNLICLLKKKWAHFLLKNTFFKDTDYAAIYAKLLIT